jgi:hypothetical protein
MTIEDSYPKIALALKSRKSCDLDLKKFLFVGVYLILVRHEPQESESERSSDSEMMGATQ